MPSSRCWPLLVSRQRTRRSPSSSNQSRRSSRRPDADLVDPAAGVRRRGDVGGDGDDARRDVGRVARQVGEHPSESGLGRLRAAVRAAQLCRHRRRFRADERRALEPPGGLRAQPGGRRVRVERRPRVVGVGAEGARDVGVLLAGEQRRVVARVPLDGQSAALHGVREDDRRAVVVDGVEGVRQRDEVVPAEVAQRDPAARRRTAAAAARAAPGPRRRGARAAGCTASAGATGTPRCPCRRCASAAPRRRGARTAPAAPGRT